MEAKSEVTIKFTGGLPEANPAPNKKVEVDITDQNGVNFSVLLNALDFGQNLSNPSKIRRFLWKMEVLYCI